MSMVGTSRLESTSRQSTGPPSARGEANELAHRLLRVHPLRAADALQLAAATIAAERRPPTLTFVTLDDRLRAAADREGFRIVET